MGLYTSVVDIMTLLLCLLVLLVAVVAEFFEPSLGNNCRWNTHHTKCEGTCTQNTQSCIETVPGTCGCRDGCNYDFGRDQCVGKCSGSHGCFLEPSHNTTCTCVDCGFINNTNKYCSGSCSGGRTCRQPKSDGPCQCTSVACSYDFATQGCVGACS
ncbi:hypothetical protein KIPB_006193, partial [Kipferlia bialata]|eukprot:g6193.t1